MNWKIHHKAETASTNIDARGGSHGDVFTADYQTAGRGRLDHVWESPRGQDLLMSVVLDAAGRSPAEVATLPLVAGLAVAKAVGGQVKWPNDVFIGGQKVAGILCERLDDRVVVGIGANVGARVWPSDLSFRAISLEEWTQSSGLEPGGWTVSGVRDRILAQLSLQYGAWLRGGFAALHPHIAAIDALKGRMVAVRQTDADADPVRGMCGGIAADGSLDVGGVKVYAGEAHVEIKANCRKVEVE